MPNTPRPVKASYLIGEPDSSDDHGWILRLKWPTCLIRIRTLIGGTSRIVVTSFSDITGQPAGKLSHIYSQAIQAFDRHTGDPKPTRTVPEVLSSPSYQPPPFLIMDSTERGSNQSWILSTKFGILIPLDAEGAISTPPISILEPPGEMPASALHEASVWLAEYYKQARLAYLSES